jgi:hypothetical protein
MTFYHGTTREVLRRAMGRLRKGTFVSPDKEVAKYFAECRSTWNGEVPLIILLDLSSREVTPISLDRHGRREAQLKRFVCFTQVVQL